MNPVKNYNNKNINKQSGGFNYNVIGSPAVGNSVGTFPVIGRPIVGHPYDIDLLRQRFSSLNNHPFSNPQDHLLQNLLFLLLIKSALKDKKSKSGKSQFDKMLDLFQKTSKQVNIQLDINNQNIINKLNQFKNHFGESSSNAIMVGTFYFNTDHRLTNKIYDGNTLNSQLNNTINDEINNKFNGKTFDCQGLNIAKVSENVNYYSALYNRTSEMSTIRNNLSEILKNVVNGTLSVQSKDNNNYYYDDDGIIFMINNNMTQLNNVYIPLLSSHSSNASSQQGIMKAIQIGDINQVNQSFTNYVNNLSQSDKQILFNGLKICDQGKEGTKLKYGTDVVLKLYIN